MRQVAMVPKTQKGRHRLPLKLLLLTTALTGVWVLRTPGNNPFTSTKSAKSQEKAVTDQQNAEAERRQPTARATESIEEPLLRLSSKTSDRSYALSLDEVVVKKANGETRSLRLSPPATRDTLQARIGELKETDPVFPVCYPEGVERNEYTRRIITPDITVQMPDGSTELPALPAGLQIKARPGFAPDTAVLEASDSFAALNVLDELKGMSTLALAELQLAVQRQPRAMPPGNLVNNQWHLKFNNQIDVSPGTDINVESIWGYQPPLAPDPLGFRGTGVRVAVIDDGLQTDHPEFAGNIDTINDKDYNDGDGDPSPTIPAQNADNHGTSVAGNVAARGNRAVGSAPEATLVGFRLIGAATTDFQEAQAMGDLNTGAALVQIKTNSWGPARGDLSGPGTLALRAIDDGIKLGRNGKGTIYLFAGGNDAEYQDNVNYDGWANSIHVIAVGAMNSAGRQAVYSERGASLAVVAPSSGVKGITTTDRTGAQGYNPTVNAALDGNYNFDFGGTSSAAPTVAGVVALMLQANPNLGWRDVKEILMRTTSGVNINDVEWQYNTAVPPFRFNPKYGAGLVNATGAVNAAKTWTNLPTQVIAKRAAPSTPAVLPSNIPDNDATGRLLQFDFRTQTADTPSVRVEHAVVTLDISHARAGDLEVTLESPGGTVSKLAERNGFNFKYTLPSWSFTSVQHWGENSVGYWRVVVKDRVTGQTGAVNSAKLELYGTPETPKNPPPVVSILTPADNAAFSPTQRPITVTISAFDSTATGVGGGIKQVDLYDNGVLVKSTAPVVVPPAVAPANFPVTVTNLNPTLGTHVYTAVAIDTENASRTSTPVRITVANQPPVIATAQVTPADQAFADQEIAVTALNITDFENDTIDTTYQWQRSKDTFTFENVDTQRAFKLTPDPLNAGYVWRCIVSASDRVPGNVSTKATNVVNILARPITTVAKGQSYSYTPGLVIRATDKPLLRQVIFNEFSQGSIATSPYTSSEWVELLTLKSGSLKAWRLTDASGNQLAFTNNAVWGNIPAGTVIVIYNGGAPKDPLLPADDTDASDKTLLISSTNPTYFVQGTYWPDFGNSGDAIALRDSNFDVVAQFSYGDDNSVTPHFASVDTGAAVQYNGDTDTGNQDAANWKVTTGLQTRNKRAVGDLPFEYGGPWNLLQLPGNMTSVEVTQQAGSLGGDTSPGSAKFDNRPFIDNQGNLDQFIDSLTITFNGVAQTLTYSITGIGNGSYRTSGVFLVFANTTAGRVEIHRFVDKNYSVESITDTLPPNTTSVEFVYQGREQGSILLDKIGIYPNNPLFLTVSPGAFPENGGNPAAVGYVSLKDPTPIDLTIAITSSDTSEATVPATVVIPAGESAAQFNIAAVDDLLSDGNQAADITVSALNYTSKTVTVIVTDNEPNADGVTPKAGNTPENIAWINGLRNGSLDSPTPFRLADVNDPIASQALPSGLTLDPVTGTIGTAVAADALEGVYNIIIVRSNVLGEKVSVSFALTVTNGAPAQNPNTPVGGTGSSSSLATFSTPSNGSGSGTAETADADGDGLGDLAEAYLGANPNLDDASAFMPVIESDGNSVSMTYRRSNMAAESLQGTVEWSNTIPGGPWSTVGVKEVVLEKNTFWTKVRATVPNPSTEAKKYLRLRIEPKSF